MTSEGPSGPPNDRSRRASWADATVTRGQAFDAWVFTRLKLAIPSQARSFEKVPEDGWPFWFSTEFRNWKFENGATSKSAVD